MATSTALAADGVYGVFLDCLFKEGEDTSNHVKVEGIVTNVGFHPDRLEGHRAEIEAMLDELPDEFKESGGGGWSFLNACFDKHGNQWTGLHKTMEELFLLGIALGKVEWLLPRDLWPTLPGSMPYLVIK